MSPAKPRSKAISKPLHGANRTVLFLLAVIILAAGVLAILVGAGLFFLTPSDALVPTSAQSWLTARPWMWWVGAGAALVIALLGLRWLIAQLRTDGVGSFDLDQRGPGGGITQVRSAGVTEALEDDAESITGVARAHARVAHGRERRVELTVVLTQDADISRVRHHLEEQSIAHLRTALDAPHLPVHVELRTATTHTTGPLH